MIVSSIYSDGRGANKGAEWLQWVRLFGNALGKVKLGRPTATHHDAKLLEGRELLKIHSNEGPFTARIYLLGKGRAILFSWDIVWVNDIIQKIESFRRTAFTDQNIIDTCTLNNLD